MSLDLTSNKYISIMCLFVSCDIFCAKNLKAIYLKKGNDKVSGFLRLGFLVISKNNY